MTANVFTVATLQRFIPLPASLLPLLVRQRHRADHVTFFSPLLIFMCPPRDLLYFCTYPAALARRRPIGVDDAPAVMPVDQLQSRRRPPKQAPGGTSSPSALRSVSGA